MSQSTESFIRSCLLSRSIEEERVIIADEQACMRTFIRDCDPNYRPRIVGKLIYLSIRGIDTAWGQMEVVNLISHDRFSYKMIAYLGCGLLLDESNERVVLITHAIHNDLQSNNPMIIQLALSLVANMGSREMYQTVSTDVQKLIDNDDPNIKKRATVCAYKIIQKLPELAETYRPQLTKILNSNVHSVVNAGILLAMQILTIDSKLMPNITNVSTAFTEILSALYKAAPSQEFRFSSFNDPFLTIRVLQFLSKLKNPTDELDDILQAIVTGVDKKRVCGRSILLQAVSTIGQTANKASLKSLAFNQIGRLFEFKDPNILYSALSCFSRILYEGKNIIDRSAADSLVLERYKSNVVTCLDHPDPSLRRRALDVVAALVDERNIETLIPEVMTYLHLADQDFRAELVTKIFSAVQRFAPNPQWNFDTALRILVSSGSYVGNDYITSVCKLISTHPDIRPHILESLPKALSINSPSQQLIQVVSYALGEFQESNSTNTITSFTNFLRFPSTSTESKCYLLTAIAKLAYKFGQIPSVTNIFEEFSKSNNIEIQQRSGELLRILNKPSLCETLFAPQDNEEVPIESSDANRSNSNILDLIDISQPQVIERNAPSGGGLLDLLGTPTNSAQTAAFQASTPQQQTQISPPPGSVEALRTASYVVYFQIQRNQLNPNQIAIQSTVFGLEKIQLTNFSMMFAVPPAWKINVGQPSGNILGASGSQPIVQQIFLQAAAPQPLVIRTQTSYMYRSQPMKEMNQINPIF